MAPERANFKRITPDFRYLATRIACKQVPIHFNSHPKSPSQIDAMQFSWAAPVGARIEIGAWSWKRGPDFQLESVIMICTDAWVSIILRWEGLCCIHDSTGSLAALLGNMTLKFTEIVQEGIKSRASRYQIVQKGIKSTIFSSACAESSAVACAATESK